MEMQRHRLTRYLAVAALALTPNLAGAQAFGLNEIGSCAFAKGFAATSAPCNDASAIFWNPAATAGMKTSLYGGAAMVLINAKFTRDSALGSHDADVPPQFPPHLFLNYAMGTNKALGIGVYVPYGLTSQWKDDFPGRFLASKAAIKSIYVQPNFSMSFRNGKYKIGGGPIYGHSTVELAQGADLSEQIASLTTTTNPTTVLRFSQLGIARRTQFAHAELEGSATSFGLNVGAMMKANEDWTFGVRYLSSLMFEYEDADATFTQDSTGIVFAAGNPLGYPAGTRFDTLLAVNARFCGAAGDAVPRPFGGAAATCAARGLLSAQTVNTQIAHPDQFQIGASYSGYAGWVLSVDYEWTGWKKFRELPVDFSNDSIPLFCTTGAPTAGCDYDVLDRELFEDYNNTSAIRIGAERTMKNGWLYRFGFSGVAAAAPDETVTPLIPEQDRTYWTLGTEIPLVKDKWIIDAAYGFVWGAGRRGRIDERASRAVLAPALNSGVYDLSAHVLSFSLKANF
jgi:long-chain fatty acid transport protein